MKNIKTIIFVLVILIIFKLPYVFELINIYILSDHFEQSKRIVLLAGILVAIIIIISQIILIIRNNRYMPGSKVIKGTIVDIKEYKRIDEPAQLDLKIEYIDVCTLQKCIYNTSLQKSLNKCKVGDEIELKYYIYKGKMKIFVDSWFNIWLTPIAIIMFAAIFIAMMAIEHFNI